ncbi:cAMP-dependent protein kinase catalytic subunit PRKX-like isoform X1 [Clavelina lepadiformis]|uniref:cAMP-dependent protein kinase catalytic subunit PRKX-like isoform X1 n=2 Tax=Clavelina lepadiformis TaxID=159417 RepID=UPI004041BD7E
MDGQREGCKDTGVEGIISSVSAVSLSASSPLAPLSSSVGNLNLPHISHDEKPNSSNATLPSQVVPSTTFGKVGSSFSLEDLEILTTIGTGTFGRVVLVKERHTKEFFALKVMKILDVIKLKQVQHVKSEKLILSQIQHPFIVQLYWTYHDDSFLYMLLDFVCGGELFSYLRNAGRFNNATSLFFASEIVSALSYLHSKDIVYRDLKPENILLDRDGHTKLTDFGFAKTVEDRTWTLCGTPEYLAPEVLQSKGHGKSVDWWALGVLIYEMLAGFPPFWDEQQIQIYNKILSGGIDFPKHMEFHAKDLIKKLLTADRTRRLGSMKNGTEDIKRHRWFQTIDWHAVDEKKLLPPIIPKVKHSGDTHNFEDYPEENWHASAVASVKDQNEFIDF